MFLIIKIKIKILLEFAGVAFTVADTLEKVGSKSIDIVKKARELNKNRLLQIIQ